MVELFLILAIVALCFSQHAADGRIDRLQDRVRDLESRSRM